MKKSFSVLTTLNGSRNFSDINIPQDILKFLSLGPGFGVAYDNSSIPVDDIISGVEQKMNMVNGDLRVKIRGEIANILKNSKSSLQNSLETKFIVNLFEKTKNFVSKHRDKIFITKPDKANETVIINRSEYVSKVKIMLSDEETYVLLKKDVTQAYQEKFTKMINFWEKKSYITTEKSKWLKSKTGTIPKFYALPKTHKDGIPLRPIVSAVTSPSYNLSKFYHDILKNVVGKRESHITNSTDFVNKIKQHKIPDNCKFVSCDVKSLFNQHTP